MPRSSDTNAIPASIGSVPGSCMLRRSMVNLIRKGTLLSMLLKASMKATARTPCGQRYGRR
jgi:hypothetical protein